MLWPVKLSIRQPYTSLAHKPLLNYLCLGPYRGTRVNLYSLAATFSIGNRLTHSSRLDNFNMAKRKREYKTNGIHNQPLSSPSLATVTSSAVTSSTTRTRRSLSSATNAVSSSSVHTSATKVPLGPSRRTSRRQSTLNVSYVEPESADEKGIPVTKKTSSARDDASS